MKSIFLFTYGLLTNRSMMDSSVKYIGVGKLPSHKLEIMNHANVVKFDDSFVEGIIWEITYDDLHSFDMIEGYPIYYDRYVEKIHINNEIIDAYVYKMTDDSRKYTLNLKPSKGYIDMITEGYGDLISTDQITKAMEDKCY